MSVILHRAVWLWDQADSGLRWGRGFCKSSVPPDIRRARGVSEAWTDTTQWLSNFHHFLFLFFFLLHIFFFCICHCSFVLLCCVAYSLPLLAFPSLVFISPSSLCSLRIALGLSLAASGILSHWFKCFVGGDVLSNSHPIWCAIWAVRMRCVIKTIKPCCDYKDDTMETSQLFSGWWIIAFATVNATRGNFASTFIYSCEQWALQR